MQIREDIETDIEDCKEEIYNHRHALRWYIWGVRIFWMGVVVVVVSFTVLPFTSLLVQSVLGTIGGITAFVCLLLGVAWVTIPSQFRDIRDHLRGLRASKHLLAKLYRQLGNWDERALRNLTPEQYLHQVPNLIKTYRKRAALDRNWFIVTQIATIVLSATITSLSGGWLDRYFSIPGIIPVIGLLISILTSFTLFFKLREKSTNLQQAADAMDWEHMACTLGIGLYKGLSRDDALVLFAERTEALRQEQQKKQLQLEQSSHAEQKALQSTN